MVRAGVLVPTTAGGKLRQLRDGVGNKEDPGGLPSIFISSLFYTPSSLYYYPHTIRRKYRMDFIHSDWDCFTRPSKRTLQRGGTVVSVRATKTYAAVNV
jgi:hypothetical protein